MTVSRPRFTTALAVVATLIVVLSAASGASADLVRTGVWGGGLAADPFRISAVAFDSKDRAYAAESGKSRVVRLDSDGRIDLGWSVGDLNGGREDFRHAVNPVDLVIDGDDNVWVLDQVNEMIRKYTTDGSLLDEWSAEAPYDLLVRSLAVEAGSVWVVRDYAIDRYSPTGTLLSTWDLPASSPEWVSPHIRGDGNGNLIVTTATITGEFSATKTISRYEPDGELISSWTTRAQTYTDFTYDEWGTYEELAEVDGFEGIVPTGLPNGSIWTAVGGKITRYGPDGEYGDSIDYERERKPRSLSMDSAGNFLFSWERTSRFGLTALNQNLDETESWYEAEFPKYASDRWEGRFDRARELTVLGDGSLASYDPSFTRVQFLGEDGDFLSMVDGPQYSYSIRNAVDVIYPDKGGAEFFQETSKELSRVGADGKLQEQIPLQIPGQVMDIEAGPNYGYVAVSRVGGGVGQVTFLWDDGGYRESFRTDQTIGFGSDARIELDSDGNIYLLSTSSLSKYSWRGDLLASWDTSSYQCDRLEFHDVALGSDGEILVLADRPAGTVFKFNDSLKPEWEEGIGHSWPPPYPLGNIDVNSEGSIYLDWGSGIERFQQPAPGAAPDRRSCLVNRIHLSAISFRKKRRWAVAFVKVPSGGKLTVGGRGIRSASREVPKAGTFTIGIVPKPQYRSTKPGLRLDFPFWVSFGKGTSRRKIETSVKLAPGLRLKNQRRKL